MLVIVMNRKAFVVAGVFLAIALIVPPYALIALSDNDLDNIVNQGPNLADATQAQQLVQELQAEHQTLFLIVLLVEVVCVALFAVFLWIGLKP